MAAGANLGEKLFGMVKTIGPVFQSYAPGLGSAVREQPESAENSAKTNALAALLGEEVQTAVNPLAGTEKRFCRDCKYRVMNAFRIYCTKHDKDVGPMDDCADYEART